MEGRGGGGEWVLWEARWGEGALAVLVLLEEWEDLRWGRVGRRLVDEELAVKVGFFLAGLGTAERGVVGELEGGLVSSVGWGWKDREEAAGGGELSLWVSRRGVFHVGVRIRAVFDCCAVDSVRGFFKIGGGREEPRLLPFSSSIVGG